MIKHYPELNAEADAIKEKIVLKYNLAPIDLTVRDTNRGNARNSTREITIPLWSYKRGKDYFISYILHELAHFINWQKYNRTGYGNGFKTIERELLRDYGIIPIYARAYVKKLLNEKGAILYDRAQARRSAEALNLIAPDALPEAQAVKRAEDWTNYADD